MTRVLRDQLIATCSDTLQGKRDRALIAVGYDMQCRRSELVSLRREDLSPLENGAMSILVRRAKNDPFGDGRYGFLSPPTAQLLIDWLDAAEIKEGFLFRRIAGRWIGPDALHPYSVNRILKEWRRKRGSPPTWSRISPATRCASAPLRISWRTASAFCPLCKQAVGSR